MTGVDAPRRHLEVVLRTGPCWEHIVQTRQVGVYVPGEIPAPQLSLVVLLDE